VAGSLSDEVWVEFCAAAQRTPEIGTRERLSRILFEEYPVFAYDRERVKENLRLGESMLMYLGAFAEIYRQAWLSHLSEEEVEAVFTGRALAFLDDKVVERGCWAIVKLRQQAEAIWAPADAVLRAHHGRRNVQKAWLYGQLCHVWIWDFHGTLTVTIPPLGGAPGGPLIDFLLAALRQAVPKKKLPNAYGLRKVIRREREGRERARQLGLFLQERRPPA
jgi:hypothetical protein